jgi:phenylacetate-coenzyme A ligase PaaK-like adenylate-forming protein
MVVTTLTKEASPLLRYRTRDVTRLLPGPCTCGSLMPRHSRIAGRTDDMFKFHGVAIYPSTLDVVLSKVPGLGSEYQVRLERGDGGRDVLELTVERGAGVGPERAMDLTRELSYRLKRELLVTVSVATVDYGSLPRSENKSIRVFDNRYPDSVL